MKLYFDDPFDKLSSIIDATKDEITHLQLKSWRDRYITKLGCRYTISREMMKYDSNHQDEARYHLCKQLADELVKHIPIRESLSMNSDHKIFDLHVPLLFDKKQKK